MKFGKGVNVTKITKGHTRLDWVDEKAKEEQKNDGSSKYKPKDYSIYKKGFEDQLLKETTAHYRRMA